MQTERRKAPRLQYPLQAPWHAASHSGSSRIGFSIQFDPLSPQTRRDLERLLATVFKRIC